VKFSVVNSTVAMAGPTPEGPWVFLPSGHPLGDQQYRWERGGAGRQDRDGEGEVARAAGRYGTGRHGYPA